MKKHPYSYIEPKVRPLVDALNAIPGITTIASCEGHFLRINHPYVYFHCSSDVAEALSEILYQTNLEGGLNWWWTLTGMFNGQHRLCFVLEAPELDHRKNGFIGTYIKYVLLRRKIDCDIGHLSNVLHKIVNERREPARGVCPNKSARTSKSHENSENSCITGLTGYPPDRVVRFAIGARPINIGRNFFSTNQARNQGSHQFNLHCLKRISTRLSHAVVAVIVLMLVLSACTSSTEIQHDGSGSDLMLKSPCACLPIPYSPPGFHWDGNRPAPIDRGDG